MPTARNPRPTLADDATIDAGIAADPDAREWTDQDMAQARPATEALPAALLAAFDGARKRGRPVATNTKVKVMLRIDPDVVDAYRKTGPGWQTCMNDALRKAVGL
ncbi:BrnA antitoxin family protein [Niveispirillum irakense]|uniref:BrnA antitoxin family protein n=1 Tax=Niveispirillum irakense TaxID=34011 RepID=UPI000414F6D9|nr:BrnA antitoxin family protein [Niveispirillum irakense]